MPPVVPEQPCSPMKDAELFAMAGMRLTCILSLTDEELGFEIPELEPANICTSPITSSMGSLNTD